MKRAETFEESVLHDFDNRFAIKVVYKRHITIDLDVPQRRIAETLRSHLENQPKRIDIYWSSAPVYQVIIDDLKSKDLTDFDRLDALIRRCPWLYVYTFHPRKETKND
jgi:hypothetical protein